MPPAGQPLPQSLATLSSNTVLITGADGMLGRAFTESLAAIPGCRVIALGRDRLDVTDREAVMGFARTNPEWIVHCAADVNADRCEKNPDACHAVQVGGSENVAALARSCGARVLFPQSFLIFDGCEEPIVEDTRPNPLSVYGRCKFEAETRVLETLGDSALVIRMAGFFGGDEKDKNFVGGFTRHARQLLDQAVDTYDVGDRIWQPTYTLDLAHNSTLLMAASKSGVYNMACHGQASFFELAVACVEELKLTNRLRIQPTSADRVAAVTDTAKRPAAAVMDNRRLRAEGLDLQRPWRHALNEYLRRPWFEAMFADLAA
jgi:dTDP-4-dehydrorhamnose reductase